MKQQTIQVYRHEDQCNAKHCKHCNKCLKNAKEYSHVGFTYCKKCYKEIKQATARRSDIYINKEIQHWLDVLTDLFCLDHVPIVILRRRKKGTFGHYRCGECWWSVTPIVINVWINDGNKVPLSTLVHEFLHATGYKHKWELNGWANFGYGEGRDRDRFTHLIVRDLTGKSELML